MTDELKVVSTFLAALINNTSITNDTSLSTRKFNTTKINLINFSTIQSLINIYNSNPSFSLKEFLFSGTSKYFDTPTTVPSIDVKYLNDYQSFYKDLIKALIEENYIFDENNNIFISSEELETVIPAEWLFKLNQNFRKDTFNKVYFYHKNPRFIIKDEVSLENYLRQVKTFMVTIKQGPNSLRKFNYAKRETDLSIDKSKTIKIDDIIEAFVSNINFKNKLSITKFKIPSITTLVNRAGMLGHKFYDLSLEDKQELLNTWLLEYLNVNEQSIIEAQKLIAAPEKIKEINKEKALTGLFSLYIQLLNTLHIDYDSISLSSFRIKEYSSPRLQEYLKELHRVINAQNDTEIRSKEEELENTILSLLNEIKEIDVSKKSDILASKQEEYYKTLDKYEKLKLIIEPDLRNKRNSLQNQINYEQSNALEEIAFDNNSIMNLIIQATKQGRIYINPHEEDELIIEIYSKELGITTFRCKISLPKLLQFINNNKKIYEQQYSL